MTGTEGKIEREKNWREEKGVKKKNTWLHNRGWKVRNLGHYLLATTGT